MIQKAHFITDKEEIIRLWQQCFEDERHYVEFFLENCPDENALFLYRMERKCVGMMLLMPGEISVPKERGIQSAQVLREAPIMETEVKKADNTYKVYYLYALCVDERQRNKGIAGELLNFAKVFAKEENAEVCLVPSTKELRSYYARRGFVDVFVRTEQTFLVEKSDEYSENEDMDISLLVKARAAEFGKNSFMWSKENLEFALKENEYSGGFAYLVSLKGNTDKAADNDKEENKRSARPGIYYIIGELTDRTLQIRETNLKLSVIRGLAKQYNCDRIHFLNIKIPLEEYPIHTRPYAMMTNQVFTEELIKSTIFYERYINFCYD